MDNVLLIAGAATTFAKVVVDMIRLGVPNLPSWVSPVMALCFGILAAALLVIADGVMLTQQVWAQIGLAGILAGGGAVGVTELSRRAQ